ncbi:MAG: alanyl-tRNA editing protein [Spirochaetales bacterium]|nr:alanyl-tRNA editing protein [Spirochaetales bacterium]
MEKLYYQDTYLRTAEAAVTSVRHTDKATEVRTDRTIFYPESGGQPGDRGFIGPYRVIDTRKADDGDSILVLDKGCPIEEGEHLTLEIDWGHRYGYMVMHAAQHMLSGLLYTNHKIGTVAVHQGEEYLTIETDRGEIEQSTVDALVDEANRAISEAHPIVYHELSHKDAEALGLRRSIKVEGDVRIVEIVGVDRIACGGVHVANTSEIRLVQSLGHELIRGHVRLYFRCGEQAVGSAIRSEKVIQSLNRRLSCRTEELEAQVEALQNALTEARNARAQAQRSLALYQVRENTDAEGLCLIGCEEGSDLLPYANAVPLFPDLAMVVLCPDKERTKWLIALKGKYEKVDFNGLIRPILTKINAKGGGRSPVFQGVANCNDSNALKGFMEEFRRTVLE